MLPFDNLSTDKEQEYFADGMTEDIITDLSKYSGLTVIARNSSFQFKGQKFDVKDVARKLGVSYIVEGSVRRGGDRVRINVQLIDGANGAHLWAERYDGSLDDIFALQDKVTGQIVTALAVKLSPDDEARKEEAPETLSAAAHDAFLRGWAHYIQTTPEDYVKAIPFFERALARDPSYGRAHAALASLYLSTRQNGWERYLRTTNDTIFEGAIAHRDAALKQQRPSPLAYQVSSRIALEFLKHDEAITEADKAIALDGNDPAGYIAKTRALVLSGRPSEAMPLIEQAMRLDPNFSAEVLYLLGQASFGAKDYPAALAALQRAHRLAPKHLNIMTFLVASHGHLGTTQEAAPVISKLRQAAKVRGYKNIPWSDRISANDTVRALYRSKTDVEHLREGLRRGGLPEFVHEWRYDRANRLSSDELRQISFGRTQVGYHPKSKIEFTISRDGDGNFEANGFFKGTGKSRIVGSRICNYWDKHKRETCMVIYRNRDGSKSGGNDYILVRRAGSLVFTLQD